jgi:eukaryotic-like serine/threonine-protein kinase
MTLSAGTQLGHYRIDALLGAGGMGEVYRATDNNLGRQVAIKVLPEAFALDAERLARFEREAKTLASLNHPNIAQIYGLEKSSGVQALVMELVEGEDLSERIARGSIPLDEALPIARQIAEALEAAHEQGIIHRDLKPANVKVRPDGTVKVLDFGLAKFNEPGSEIGDRGFQGAPSMSPTITSPAMMTGIGVLLGTAAYMAPEQAKGKPADRRSDIWAFGCVVYEMLAGQRAFAGDDVAETLATVIKGEPDWHRLPRKTPPAIRRLLRRCLAKDRKARIADAGVARLEIDDALTSVSESGTRVTAGSVARRRWPQLAGAFLVGSVLTGIVVWIVGRAADPIVAAPGVTRTSLDVAPTDQLALSPSVPLSTRTAMAISPDGQHLVFSATRSGKQQLYLRTLDRLEATPIAGTEESNSPFFSPDGQWVGFWKGTVGVSTIGEIKKVPLNGGPAVTLCKTPLLFGASWGSNNTNRVRKSVRRLMESFVGGRRSGTADNPGCKNRRVQPSLGRVRDR